MANSERNKGRDKAIEAYEMHIRAGRQHGHDVEYDDQTDRLVRQMTQLGVNDAEQLGVDLQNLPEAARQRIFEATRRALLDEDSGTDATAADFEEVKKRFGLK